MAIIDKIIGYLKDKGPQFGPDMCEALALPPGSLTTYMKSALADGRVTAEKAPYKGSKRMVNRFTCTEAPSPEPVSTTEHRFDSHDPFGLVAKAASKQASAAPPVVIPQFIPSTAVAAPQEKTVVAVPAPRKPELEIGIFSSGRLSISNKAGEMTLSKGEVNALLAFVRGMPEQFFSTESA